ncbi:CadD family cadmium resistance transporter [Planococcus sp. CP5-4]|uniref:CadD family cadmium resistance transporter n=1 Tax=unclassified Planococcus (in: firmicutes) TaxID=2662419 RepID=UPI001C242457|nr:MULTISPECIES: CadD family cadmium resistance transporter [unclassified Planococcus (in: firmicutes)]MBU9673375.1 CadD family cadmium resistance transporter [Planococcus sp. CP5-4_YE]MBV0908148.1 CadD family cadmium resistance transporter [Planococcus sp. CP5-4_UN]MBW6062209.1 CadD family cadmium resistance transporter [Planococcus sp. CP5-4]
MFQVIATSFVLYLATAVDLIAILLIFFARAETRKQARNIYIGQYVGSLTLIVVSLFLAYVLNFVPEKWILGLLGLIPIYFGLKVAISGDSDEEYVEDRLSKHGLSKLVKTVALVTIGSCGADNIGLFVPYFLTLDTDELVITLIVFLILIYLMAFTAQKIVHIPGIGEVIEKYSRWIMAIIYIGLGLFIIYKNNTIQKIVSFF